MHKYGIMGEFPLDSAHLLSNDDDILGNVFCAQFGSVCSNHGINLHNQQ